MRVLSYLYNLAYFLSYSSTSFIEFITSQVSSLSNRNTNNTRSVILAFSFLTLSLKIYSILKSLIRGVLLFKLI